MSKVRPVAAGCIIAMPPRTTAEQLSPPASDDDDDNDEGEGDGDGGDEGEAGPSGTN